MRIHRQQREGAAKTIPGSFPLPLRYSLSPRPAVTPPQRASPILDTICSEVRSTGTTSDPAIPLRYTTWLCHNRT